MIINYTKIFGNHKWLKLLSVFVCLQFFTQQLYAQNYTVSLTSDGNATNQLRGALVTAGGITGSHIITVNAGTYTLTSGEIDFGTVAGSNVTINGAGQGVTIIDGNNNGRFFQTNPSGTITNLTVTVNNVTIRNCKETTDDFGGGAVECGGSANNVAIFNNCTFQNNTVSSTLVPTPGGAIRAAYASLAINACTFTNNTNPNSDGGAVRFDLQSGESGTLSITNSTFTGNTAPAAGAQGGAISIGVAGGTTFSCTVTENTFFKDTANTAGGAISISNGLAGNTANINYNSFVNNIASDATRSAVTVAASSGNVNLSNNWWGCNLGYSGCADRAAATGAGGTYTFDPYLQLKTTSSSGSICPAATTTISSGFTSNSTSGTVLAANLDALIGKPISFSAVNGSISGAQTTIQSNGLATATFTAAANTTGANITGTVNAVVDNVPTSDLTARASITIKPTTTIVTAPGTSTVCAGGTASLSVGATGSNLSYQWRRGTTNLNNGVTGTGSTISNATTANLLITTAGTSDAGSDYNVVVSGDCGSGIISTNGTVVVNLPGNWTGATNTSWTTGTNWGCGTVPTNTTNVTIPITGNMPTLTGSGICNSITISSGATLTLAASATLDIKGDLVVNGTFTTNTGSTTSFSGGTQAIAGVTYYNLLLNGAGSKTLSSAATVNNTLTLTAGMLSLGANNLTIGNTGSISGATANSYIVTNGTGGLVQQNIGTGGRTGGISFPVGSSTTSYTPVTLTNTGTLDTYTVGVLNSLSSSYNTSDVPTGTTQTTNAVGRTWLVKEATAGGSNVTLGLQWNTADQLTGFNTASCYISHFFNGFWHPGASSAASGSNPYTQTISGITVFSPFGVGSAGSPLPLNLLSFTGRLNGNAIQLDWSTSAEKNVDYFIIERSSNGVDFGSIANVAATGNNSTGTNNYSYTDAKGSVSTYYYRLKMVDKDGTFTYSDIVVINNINNNGYIVQVTPNPFQSQVLINVTAPQDARLTIELMDMSGKKLMTQSATVSQGNNTITVSQLANFAHGTYLLHLYNNNINQTIKLIKTK